MSLPQIIRSALPISEERRRSAKRPAALTDKEIKTKIEELRALEKQGFGPRHGKTDYYEYLEAVFNFCDWTKPNASARVARRVAKLYDVKTRVGKTPMRTVIDATSKQDRQVKSLWARALEYAVAKKVCGEAFIEFLEENGGVARCAAKMAALGKRRIAAFLKGTVASKRP
jgi:hypothetical protein